MTPKEKANELYDLFVPQVRLKLGQEDYKDKAKQCALISVDEILKHCYEVMKPFWEEVKQEIEKL
jgi:hypothetical protein